jgi:3-hydroxy-9,10-secoandrosta-1,3,5(10)-triene-9,17-dione monooxygenase
MQNSASFKSARSPKVMPMEIANTAALDSRSSANGTRLDHLIARARQLSPILRERAAAAEALRRLPEESAREFCEAGFFKIFQPARYGGYELDYGPTQLALGDELGRGCGSSAWVFSVVACHAWILGMLSPEVQDEVWGASPEALLGSAFAPEQSTLSAVAGGYRLSGRWRFSSGIDLAQWVILGAPMAHGAAASPDALWCVLPRTDYRIIDTWHASGLRATGSNDVIVDDAFIPVHRTAALGVLAAGRGPGTAANDCHIYRLPLWNVFSYNLIAPAFGIVRGALEDLTARARRQPPSPLGRGRLAESEGVQLQIAEAAALTDSAEALVTSNAHEFNDLARRGGAIEPEMSSRIRRDVAFAGLACMRAVDLLNYLNGAHGLTDTNVVQRAFRDIHAINAHFGMQWRTGALEFGRRALGATPAS